MVAATLVMGTGQRLCMIYVSETCLQNCIFLCDVLHIGSIVPCSLPVTVLKLYEFCSDGLLKVNAHLSI